MPKSEILAFPLWEASRVLLKNRKLLNSRCSWTESFGGSNFSRILPPVIYSWIKDSRSRFPASVGASAWQISLLPRFQFGFPGFLAEVAKSGLCSVSAYQPSAQDSIPSQDSWPVEILNPWARFPRGRMARPRPVSFASWQSSPHDLFFKPHQSSMMALLQSSLKSFAGRRPDLRTTAKQVN